MARRQVTIFINGKEVANNIKSIAAEKVKVNNQLAKMTRGTAEYEAKVKELRKLNGIIKEHNDNIRGVSGTWDKVKGAIGKFAAVAGIAFAATEIVNYGKELFKLGTEMEVLVKKAETVFGEALPQVTAEAEKNATAMGLTTNQYINAAAAMGDLLVPMKFTREEAAGISTTLVNLSGALSEWTGGQRSAEEVSTILGKAILGEREQLKELGISILEADVQNRLAEKGLKGLTGEMLQQAKTAATLELITEKTADAQAAYAANSDTLVRRQAELSAKFNDIKETMATALIPVFTRLLEIVEPVVTTFFDFIKALINGDKQTSQFTGVMKILGVIFSNVWKVAEQYFGTLFKIGSYLFEKLSPALSFVGGLLVDFYNTVVIGVNKLNELLGFELRLEKIDLSVLKKNLDDEQKKLDKNPLEVTVRPTTTLTPEQAAEIQRQKEAAEKRAKERQKEREREEKETQNSLARIKDIIKKYQDELALQQLSDDDKSLELIRQKYQKEIDAAARFKDQVVELERLRDLELEAQRKDNAEKQRKAQEQADYDLEKKIEQFTADRLAFEAQLNSELDTEVLSARELAIQNLDSYYNDLKEKAAEYGLSTAVIEETRRLKLKAINDKYNNEDNSDLVQAQKEKLQVLQSTLSATGNLFSSFFQLLGNEEGDFAELQKISTLAQITFDTASAISSLTAASEANPTNAVTFGGAGIVQFITGLARILGNIAQARQVLKKAPKVPQKADGGWMNAIGADDNIGYNVKYIGQPVSGMLPNHPVMFQSSTGSPVIASERGREYFVSNSALKNPYVMNYVQAIDNIVRSKTRQFAAGGSTGTAIPALPPQPQGNDNDKSLSIELARLNDNLEAGIMALINDDQIIALQRRINQLNKASGGALGQ